MSKGKKIIIGVLLIGTGFFVYSIITNPLANHDIIFGCALVAGFIALESNKRKEDRNI